MKYWHVVETWENTAAFYKHTVRDRNMAGLKEAVKLAQEWKQAWLDTACAYVKGNIWKDKKYEVYTKQNGILVVTIEIL